MGPLRPVFCALLATSALLGLACGDSGEAGGAIPHSPQSNEALSADRAEPELPPPLQTGGQTPAQRRRALVLAAAGDAAQWPRWLANATCGQPAFDLALIYFGASPFFGCSACVRVWHARGAKWNLVYQAVQAEESWRLVSSYHAVMLADDDLMMTAADIELAFEAFSRHRLDLAQLSICRQDRSTSAWDVVFQRPGSLLRYTNFVEVMAPIVSHALLPQLRTLLEDSYSGWGLDFLLPFVLGYPRDRIAIIDAACMVHPTEGPPRQAGRPARQRMYSADLPRTPKEEWDLVLKKHGMNRSSVAGQGLPFGEAQTYGSVPLDAWAGPAKEIKCSTAADVLGQQLPAAGAAALLPLLRLSAWLLQAALASCGAVMLALKALDALRSRRSAVVVEGNIRQGRPTKERSAQRSGPRILVLKQ